jgi:tetratricopeptide (TPR) repeat protein
LLGDRHPALGAMLNNLALVYKDLDRHDDAETALVRSLAIKEAELGAEHPSVAPTLINLATFDRRRGDFAMADVRWQRAYRVRVAALGDKHPDVTRTLHDKLIDRFDRGLDDEALELARDVVARWAAQNSKPEHGSALGIECELHRRRGALDTAEARCAKALEILGDDGEPRRIVNVLAYATRVAIDRRDIATARTRLAAAEAALGKVKRDPPAAEVAWSRARLRLAEKRTADAVADASVARDAFVAEGAGKAYRVAEIDRVMGSP